MLPLACGCWLDVGDPDGGDPSWSWHCPDHGETYRAAWSIPRADDEGVKWWANDRRIHVEVVR